MAAIALSKTFFRIDCCLKWSILINVMARSHIPKRKDYVWIAYNSRLLREFYAIAGFERFKTLLRVQIDVFLTRINVFLTKLTPFLRDPYVIRAQIAPSRSTTHNPTKSPKTRAKVGNCTRSIRNPSVWPV